MYATQIQFAPVIIILIIYIKCFEYFPIDFYFIYLFLYFFLASKLKIIVKKKKETDDLFVYIDFYFLNNIQT